MEAADDPFHLREILWSDEEDFFALQLPTRHPRDEDDEARSALSRDAKLVPRSLYQTSTSPALIRTPEPLPEDSYIKVGTIFYFHPEIHYLAVHDSQEARVCGTLMKYPHQNVTQYYGYAEKDGLMGGLCFRRYGQTFLDAMRTGLIRREDVEHSLDQIKKGSEHIHDLGLVHVSIFLIYAHNDINPRNVLLDAGGKLVIIDFDSCRKQGEPMLDGENGTFPFSDDPETAGFQNNFYGLEKIRWVEENIA
ncbi:hypothetical protein F5146DRAFT_935456 [Armillaria mellea]|nr:hypothetical protein F5146DRAFT_935456 [Armillaria mellea]